MFARFWQLAFNLDLKTVAPLIELRLNQWDKQETTKQADIFQREEVQRFCELPDTADNIVIKAFVVAAMSFAARGAESKGMEKTDVQRIVITDAAGRPTPAYRIFYDRVKKIVAGSNLRPHTIVQDAFSVAILDRYLATFKEDDAGGKFVLANVANIVVTFCY